MDKKIKTIFSIIFTVILIQSITNPAIEGHQLYVFSDENNKDNWEQINHNVRGTNYSPQNQINSDNAHMLELKWTFPIPPATEFNEQGVSITEGSMTPPLIINGTVYFTSNMRDTYAIDSVNGSLKWVSVWNFDWQEAYRRLPITGGALHVHGLNLIDGKLFPSTVACSILAINPEDGEIDFELNNTCRDIEGNEYNWDSYTGPGLCGLSSHPGIEYENIYVTQICGADSNWGGRAFIDGYDLNANPPERLWRTFLSPPSEGDPEWALRECDKGWFFSYPEWKESGRMGIPCNEVPRENLINDWGVPKHYTSSVAAIWGQMALDQETGIVYFGTGNQGGWPNQTHVTGPNLYSSATLAVDVKSGEIIWWYQQVARDMVEGDTSWNTVLTELNINGEKRKAIIKYSVTGLLWALDAATGEPLWIYESPILKSRIDSDGVTRGRTSGHPCIGCDPRTQDGYWNDVMSHYDMKEKKWLNYPSKDWFYWIPARAGEADIALNTDLERIYVPVAGGVDKAIKADKYGTLGVRPGQDYYIDTLSKNVTLYSLDANTGEEVWSHFIDGVAYRGGVMTSGGVVFLPVADGNLYMFNAETGEIIDKMFLGNSLVVLPTIGYTKEGEARVFVISGGRGAYAIGGMTQQNIPGAIYSFGLPEGYIQQEEVVEEKIEVIEQEVESQIKEEINEQDNQIEQEDYTIYYLAGIAVLIVLILIIRRR